MTAFTPVYQQKWDERYRQQEYAYGKAPNMFFKEWLARFTPGNLLMPAEGEGRNGVYAATQGWQVTAFDISEAGRNKALQLAAENGVSINYLLGTLDSLPFTPAFFDAIGLIYAHVEGGQKAAFHQLASTYLRPGGVLLLEAFSKKHLAFNRQNPAVGGPKEVDMLLAKEELAGWFADYDVLLLEETVVHLQEGVYHNGEGAVIRFVGRKR